MKKTVEIGINVLFWLVVLLCMSILLYEKVTTDFPDEYASNPSSIADLFLYWLLLFYYNGMLGMYIIFYVFYAWVVPDFIKQKRAKRLWFSVPLAAIISLIVSAVHPLLSLLLKSVDPIMSEVWVRNYSGQSISQFLISAFINIIVIGGLGVLFKATILWVQSISEKKALQKKQLESENALLLLKAQLNPHFLFNSLNNIDVLMEESVPKASNYLKKLSDILRYVLYETKEDTTTLSKELEQIENYIELQKIRTSNTQFVEYVVKGQVGEQSIVPMIFLPFVENAFKFSKNKSIEHGIQIRFEVLVDSVRMLCRNRFELETVLLQKSEGLGIETIRKRLELLYPKQYQLTIDSAEGWFTVDLRVPLNHGS